MGADKELFSNFQGGIQLLFFKLTSCFTGNFYTFIRCKHLCLPSLMTTVHCACTQFILCSLMESCDLCYVGFAPQLYLRRAVKVIPLQTNVLESQVQLKIVCWCSMGFPEPNDKEKSLKCQRICAKPSTTQNRLPWIENSCINWLDSRFFWNGLKR